MKQAILKNKKAFGAVGALLACLLIGAIVFSLSAGAVLAFSSLPHINTIVGNLKTSGNGFNILQIADDEKDSFGYYAVGQEPFSGWRQELAKLQSPASRMGYMKNLYNDALDIGMISQDSDTPLTSKEYKEAFPWETYTPDMHSLTLEKSEEAEIVGTMKKTPGPYLAAWRYSIKENGDYIQKISYLMHSLEVTEGEDVYYYSPVFKEINPEGQSLPVLADGVAVYSRNEESGNYVYVGTAGSDLTLDSSVLYFVVDVLGEPHNEKSGYAAVSTGFEIVDGKAGHFSRDFYAYEYVGGQRGDYSFAVGVGANVCKIAYKTVYYSGGYTNNNWMAKYIFDQTDGFDKINIFASNIQAAEATEEMVSTADMIILSAKNGSLSEEVAAAIYAKGSGAGKCPIIVDLDCVENGSGSAAELGRIIISRSQSGLYVESAESYETIRDAFKWNEQIDRDFVSGNVYCFARTGDIAGLATAKLFEAYSDEKGFEDILLEIDNENFLRSQQGMSQSEMLPRTISPASAARYIINYGGRRTTSIKEKIRVLELQAGNGRVLTTSMVSSWLGGAIPAAKITIVTMSTSEFVGKIENLNENYDMIYIGASKEGFKLDAAKNTDYQDDSMDGMLYTNVGDIYRTTHRMAGLLDRDYNFNQEFLYNGAMYPKLEYPSDTADVFRFSGNDITASRAQELRDFAEAGYPVIFADELMGKQEIYTLSDFSVNVSASRQGNTVMLTASPAATEGDMPERAMFLYEWYRTDGVLMQTSGTVTQRSNSYIITDVGTYYCKVTASVQGEDNVGAIAAEGDRWTASNSGDTYTIEVRDSAQNGIYTVSEMISARAGIAMIEAEDSEEIDSGDTMKTGVPVRFRVSEIYEDGAKKAEDARTKYAWQVRDGDKGTWANIKNTTTGFGTNITGIATNQMSFTTAAVNGSKQIRCVITITSGEASYELISDIIELQGERKNRISFTRDESDFKSFEAPQERYYTAAISADVNAAGKVSLSLKTSLSRGTSVTGVWYVDDAPTFNSPKAIRVPYSGDSASRFTYEYDASSITYNTKKYFASNVAISGAVMPAITDTPSVERTRKIVAIRNFGTGMTGKMPLATGTVAGTSKAYVDNSSYMFEAMNDISAKPNVMTATAAQKGTAVLLQYLNLSKPEVVWTRGDSSYPVVYEKTLDGATSITPENGVNYLKYSFKIENATDATPTLTKYDCELHLDLNADGKYSDEEEISDTVIRTADGRLVTSSGGAYSLSAGTEYVLTRQMPDGYAGFISWNISIVKNGAQHIHASKHGYTRIEPQADKIKTLNVLQINSNSNRSIMNLEMHQQIVTTNTGSNRHSAVTRKTYWGIYGKLLADVTDFNVKIKTVAANGYDMRGQKDAVYSFLNEFDMVIIGFDDMYAELSKNAADAIVGYIGTGKAVLFTHDTTSQANVPFRDYQMTNGKNIGFGSDLGHWGYEFNTALRSPVSLDRYGITAEGYKSDTRAQTDSTDLTEEQKARLLAGGYSIAYKPGSARTETVAETQGYTNHGLRRYGQISGKYPVNTLNGKSTTYVSQVNEGQITTYPYDVNTLAFGGTDRAITSQGGNYMETVSTHEQYYQLNLNSEDVIVWYCMANKTAGQCFSFTPNDVVNAYYIYNKGNVTYSGAGHSAMYNEGYTDVSVPDRYVNEAKLFVNTMIAAYRTAAEPPKVAFTDSGSGVREAQYMFITSDTGNVLDGTAENDNATKVYIKIADPTLSRKKTISLGLTYQDKTGARVPFKPKLYYADRESDLADTKNLKGGLVYMFYLPPEVIAMLKEDDISRVGLEATVTTVIEDKTYVGTGAMEVRKIGLFELR